MPEEPHALDAPDVAVPAQGPTQHEYETPEQEAATQDQALTQDQERTQEQGQEPKQKPVVARPRRTRISGLWIALGCFGVLLLFALLFILQNDHSVNITYFGAHGHLPLGVALLLAAICGGMLVTLVGTARILQLRAHARRRAKKAAD